MWKIYDDVSTGLFTKISWSSFTDRFQIQTNQSLRHVNTTWYRLSVDLCKLLSEKDCSLNWILPHRLAEGCKLWSTTSHCGLRALWAFVPRLGQVCGEMPSLTTLWSHLALVNCRVSGIHAPCLCLSSAFRLKPSRKLHRWGGMSFLENRQCWLPDAAIQGPCTKSPHPYVISN